ncbi:hypothetical protein U9M48_003445 [Paspalum notatum var. saurae]|uniref:Uncharacterized protein n=1 Tax=Paspalum notatum var. saurae TaxID=547442 RepID=A0AAQ3PLI5_PASNO
MIGDIHQRVTHSSVASLAFFFHSAYVASFESRDVSHALSDPNWVNSMHEELENFERNHVCDLVEPPPNCCPIGTKWVFKNKQARLEAIRILLAFAASKGFKLSNGCQLCIPKWVHRVGGICETRKTLRVLDFKPVLLNHDWEFEMSLMGELLLLLQIKQGLEVPLSIKPSTQGTYSRSLT